MLVLGFDTTASTVSAALLRDGKLISQYSASSTTTHSTTLLPAIETLLQSASLKAENLDLICCSAGPGSFTGVRIGCATAKGLAAPFSIPCVGVSSLEALALNVSETAGIICPVMDARRNQLYNALFKYDNGELKRLTEDRVLSADELKSELAGATEEVYLTGDGSYIAAKALAEMNVKTPHEVLCYHNAYNVALLAYRAYSEANEQTRLGFTAEALAPVYLRMSQAERERLENLEKNKN